MKLLIITQVMDYDHPILGFFHRWVEEFSKNYEGVQVICLQEGKHNLPSNVKVHSLGKEKNKNKFSYLINFYKLIWSLRNEYDYVFVHMNQIYVILGAPFWRAYGKKIGLWYAHGTVSNSLKLSVLLADILFTSTEQGMRINTPKRKLVGQGVDLEKFKKIPKQKNDILQLVTVGRISASKNIDTLLRACAIIKAKNANFRFIVIGIPTTATEELYAQKMLTLTTDLKLQEVVEWVGGVPNQAVVPYLQQSDIFIHDGSTNSLDKTLIEASLCGCVVISSNPAYKDVTKNLAPEFLFKQGDYEELAKIIANLPESDEKQENIRQFFLNNFSVGNLISGIVNKY